MRGKRSAHNRVSADGSEGVQTMSDLQHDVRFQRLQLCSVTQFGKGMVLQAGA